MAEAVVSVAVETLGNLLKEEVRFLRRVRGQVEELRTDMGNLQSLLKDADRKQHDSEMIRNWIKEIRRLAYRAEDVLEEYVVKVGSGDGDRGFINILKRFVCFANEMGTLRNLGSEIATIKSQIKYLTEKMYNLGIVVSNGEEETSGENKQRFIRKTHPHEELQHFVGMDEDIKKLVSLLVSDESGHGVIGLWGMGGSGKTTVARKVYNHVDVKRIFDSFAWVCITQKCQIQSVKREILRQLLPEKKEDIKEMSEDEMVEQIFKMQEENKCLIVLDDIWKLEDWECLSTCFSTGGSHSKVLLTTRIRQVACIGDPITLNGFTEDEAWMLLRMKAFAKFEEPGEDYEYENLGRRMIRRCDRLPLAVAVLGGILSGKNSLHEWKLASEDVNSYIRRGEGTGVPGKVEKVLALSYDELPYHLKPCFLSLGCLQEDESVPVETIYGLWMAEGFIQSKHIGIRETMHDVAKCYLNELQFRSMVQFDNFVEISLHDSVLDMCLSKAKQEEFLKVVNKYNISVKAYRLVVRLDDEDNDLDALKAVENITPLRSIQITSKRPCSKWIDLPKEIFNRPQFKSLRALIVYYCNFRGKCFHGVENLIHLRFLGLRGCGWENFSLESVHKLSFLQTLALYETEYTLIKFPSVDAFCKMRQLKHLYLPSFPNGLRIEGKLRLMDLSQLETLYHFHSEFYDLNDLFHLQKLRTLRSCTVHDDESLVQITDYICGSNLRWIDIYIENCDLNGQQESDALRKLLKIQNVTLELVIRSCELMKLPRLETVDFSNPGLVTLQLSDATIEEDIMRALGKFPNLKILELRCIRFGGEEMICDAGSFPRLQQLFFFSVEGKFELRIDEAAMPNLSTMEIAGCRGVNFTIPERLRCLMKLIRV